MAFWNWRFSCAYTQIMKCIILKCCAPIHLSIARQYNVGVFAKYDYLWLSYQSHIVHRPTSFLRRSVTRWRAQYHHYNNHHEGIADVHFHRIITSFSLHNCVGYCCRKIQIRPCFRHQVTDLPLRSNANPHAIYTSLSTFEITLNSSNYLFILLQVSRKSSIFSIIYHTFHRGVMNFKSIISMLALLVLMAVVHASSQSEAKSNNR